MLGTMANRSQFTKEQINKFYPIFVLDAKLDKMGATKLKNETLNIKELAQYGEFSEEVIRVFSCYKNQMPTMQEVIEAIAWEERRIKTPLAKARNSHSRCTLC